MSNSRTILLKLVRAAMGWERDFSLPENIDWQEVFDLAFEQGVYAIVLDGLEICQEKHPKAKPIADEDKPLLLEAIGQAQLLEANFRIHQSTLMELAKILDGKGIPFMLMKGFSCGQYYPNPQQRPCGDIDIYPGKRFEESNIALSESGVSVDPHYYRHTVSYINEVMIENHRVLGDLRGDRKQSKEFECWLEKEALTSIREARPAVVNEILVPGCVFPSANFNVLFLPWHVSAHFSFEKVTLRHLLDWALFLIHEGKNIDVDFFSEAKNRFTHGYRKMADILTNLALRYLNISVDDIPLKIIEDAVNFDNSLADKVLNYMFIGQPRERDANIWKFRWNNVKRVWAERWKYKEVYDMTMPQFLMLKARGVIFKEGDED